MRDILIEKKEERKVDYVFTVNTPDPVNNTQPTRRVTITFKNDKFFEASFDVSPKLTARSHWLMLGAIAKKIEEIEQSLNAPLPLHA